MYENQTYAAILQRMLDNVEVDIDKSEGSIIYNALAPAAMELEQCYVELDEVLNRAFAQTSYENYLDMKAGESGITRKSGTNATGTVVFTGANNTVIPQGTVVQTDSALQYITQSDATIQNGTATVNIQAADIGIIYNVPSNTINQLPIAITGVSSVTNSNTIAGGAEIEADVSLLSRLDLKAQEPGTSGNQNDYKQWALSVVGVGNTKVISRWAGVNTVKVVIIDSNEQPASSDLVTNVTNYIETNRPLGSNVTVISALAELINISVSITKDSNYTDTQITADISSKITTYLQSIAFHQSLVSYAQVGSLILSVSGVLDYTNLKLNNGTTNISIDNESVAVLGTVTLNE